jgi:hypothetical protein
MMRSSTIEANTLFSWGATEPYANHVNTFIFF